jgi:hypothetical protein
MTELRRPRETPPMPGMMPVALLKNLELNSWQVPEELSGLVTDSFEELKARFPPDDKFGEVYLRENESEEFGRYSRPRNGLNLPFVDIAYHCPECDDIVIGPPRLEIEGERDIGYYCASCRMRIHTKSVPFD